MVERAINRLSFIIEKLPKILLDIDENILSEKPNPSKWSKKEIIGHLIDSATNNHQRFVRGQFESNPEIVYNQDNWNTYNFYQDIESKQIISFWTIYNKQLIEVIKRIPAENYKKLVKIGENQFSIEFLVLDYVEHLEYHIKQITNY